MEQKIDYKDVFRLKKYITRRGKILPRAKTGLTAKAQRALAREVKKARYMALIPYISRD
jgi:small subunit ribosomal protein S18